ncbi:Serine/threonine protein kinase [Phytophthora cinnamomi]|uniref:Serine/threonine protein kinase n=1 Tax=Phytophthora cinnamomi TaxID=4785 RepID=UPI003559DCC7|nr:Serine/threonine protein kinase [Phytophthora cinnamomi]
MRQWEQQWDADRAEQYEKLHESMTSSSDRMLVNEFRGDKEVVNALLTLNSGMTWKGQSEEMLQLKMMVFSRALSFLRMENLREYEWFIPIDNVE